MKTENSSSDELSHNSDIFIPNISVDCIILGFHAGSINVLLCKFKVSNRWMLPGSFVAKDEHPDETALRILKKRTCLHNAYLKQFYFFGRDGSINYDNNKEILKRFNDEYPREQWNCNRFISLAYYALIKHEQIQLLADEHEECAWFNIKEIPALYPDHKEVLDTALETIRRQIGYIPIGYKLLPEKFTMPELRNIYESILGREIDRRNFQRKMLSIGYIEALNEIRKVGPHKSPNLYSFIEKKYEDAEKYGIQFMSNNF
ncbi:NUDIX domain-containing protein [Dysgonomonas sp. Marseille-P4677]|uniref:NUDIX hydrolase n=1 Tax=Dysgonomonas sp. Marseille-P4677 TaxID=2364790 RepID=UPI001911375D|nr:NUDIX domain-containing protein [Dysgonomonas sp. Marseille-P4677]MBK5719346.1 NUDIX domain-containing protein [Dysgonomonas sp. Marseille-P4677]